MIAQRRYSAIFVLGASSSGKTTLCVALNARLGPSIHIQEVAREVMRDMSFTREDVGTMAMQRAIFLEQLRKESLARDQQAKEVVPPIIIGDRSAVDPIVYAKMHGNQEGGEGLISEQEFQKALLYYRRSLFVVLQPVAGWQEDDGVRTLDSPWEYHEDLTSYLRRFDIPFRELGEELTDISKRVAVVTEWLTKTPDREVFGACIGVEIVKRNQQ